MADANATRASRADETRAEETRRERRMKPGTLERNGINLVLDESRLDRQKFEYRFVNDTPGRVQRLVARDYDIVTDAQAKPDSKGLGSVPTVHGGIEDAGKPYNMVLMAKYRDWYEGDKARQQAQLDDRDQAVRRGIDHKHDPNLPLQGSGVYTPEEGNRIERYSESGPPLNK